MSPFNQPKGMVAYGDMKVMLILVFLFIRSSAFSVCRKPLIYPALLTRPCQYR